MQAQYRALEKERRRQGLPSFTTPKIFGSRQGRRRRKKHAKDSQGVNLKRLDAASENREITRAEEEVSPWDLPHAYDRIVKEPAC